MRVGQQTDRALLGRSSGGSKRSSKAVLVAEVGRATRRAAGKQQKGRRPEPWRATDSLGLGKQRQQRQHRRRHQRTAAGESITGGRQVDRRRERAAEEEHGQAKELLYGSHVLNV